MKELSASEALFGFMGWLTSLETPVTFSARDYAGTAAELVDEFCKANNLAEPRDGWHENFVYPSSRPTLACTGLAGTAAVEGDGTQPANH